MDFKETYKKYLDGTATEEEKTFVEAEIEKAKIVNSEIIANTKTADNDSAEKKKAKKKKSLRQTLKTIIISLVVFMIISIVAFVALYNISVSNAVDNIKIQPEDARVEALDYAFMYARDHYGYSGSVEGIVSPHDMDTRELVFKLPLSKCYYVYEFEFIAGEYEFDIQVNSTTGMAHISDIDRID